MLSTIHFFIPIHLLYSGFVKVLAVHLFKAFCYVGFFFGSVPNKHAPQKCGTELGTEEEGVKKKM